MFIKTDIKYGSGIKLDEYNGTYSLINAEVKDGEVYKRWCKPQIGRDRFAEKNLPLGVRLGDRKQSIVILKQFLAELQGTKEKNSEPKQEEPENDVPF